MEEYSKLHLEQLKALTKQVDARLSRTKHNALTNEWIQRHIMRNYQS
jgi:hypothetical protein